jgi:hypothetical protein
VDSLHSQSRVVYRPSRSTWVALLAVWVGLALIGTLVAITRANLLFPVLWIGLGGGAITCVFLSTVALEWSPQELRYRALFRTRSIRFQDIESATMSNLKGPLTPPFMLLLKPKDHAKQAVAVNLKLFSTTALRPLRDVLGVNGITVSGDQTPSER